jgi:hydrogenase 3 maturation protease
VDLKKELQKRLRKASRIVLLGVGSELRSDDAAGLLVAKAVAQSKIAHSVFSKLKVFLGGTAPENFSGEIKKFNPRQLIIVDSAELNQPAGTVKLIAPDKIGGVSFCTHQLPLKIFIDYLLNSLKCDIIVIGIQPKIIDFGEAVSPPVKKAAKLVAQAIVDVLKENTIKKRGEKKKCRV